MLHTSKRQRSKRMTEIENTVKEFNPVYLVIKTREEFDFILGLVAAHSDTAKAACVNYSISMDKAFFDVLDNYLDLLPRLKSWDSMDERNICRRRQFIANH